MNQITLIGRLTKDPTTGSANNGSSYTKFSIAVDREYRTANGERPVDFFDVTCWSKLAEVCANNLYKGRLVCVVGQMYSSDYTDNDGKKRRFWDVKANSVEFLDSKKSAQPEQTAEPAGLVDDGDVPF